jgi:tetratricopeptide (TPR) repeat protein
MSMEMETGARRLIKHLEAESGDGALHTFLARLTSDSEDLAAWNALAKLLLEQNKPAEAATSYREALRISPADAQMLAMLGIALAQQGKLSEALENFHESLRLDPNRAPTHYNLAVALAQRANFPAAEVSLREALRLSPNYPEAHASLARVHSAPAPLPDRKHEEPKEQASRAYTRAPTKSAAQRNYKHTSMIPQ